MSDIFLKNVSFGYDDQEILKNIDLEYDCSDFLSIIGPNGSGKSTLLKLILGLIKPNTGLIKIFNKSPKQNAKLMGYVPQIIGVNKNFPLSVLEVVLMGLIDRKIFGFYTKNDKQKAMEALNLVKMDMFSDKKISDLSGGQRQRVYIARAICAKAKILILDEPLSSIDPNGQIQIYELLKNLNQNNIGIIMISHDVNIALNYASKVLYICNGEMFMHEIKQENRKFLDHLRTHGHFCDIEIALKECQCGKF